MSSARTDRMVQPSAEFIRDIRYTVKNSNQLARKTGLPQHVSQALFSGAPIRSVDMDMALQNFYNGESLYRYGEIAMQMQALQAHGKISVRKLYSMLRYMVKFVVDFEGMTLSTRLRPYWAFPPRNTLRRMVELREECMKLLRQLHYGCPHLDKIIFRDHPELLERFCGGKNGTRRVHTNVMSKVRGGAKKRKPRASEKGKAVQSAD